MSIRATAIEAHPDFPWLLAADLQRIEAILRDLDWLQPNERVEDVGKAGEGNMNLTLRITTDRRSAILKQARPWVEKYDHIPAPWDRILFEQGFYERVQSIPEVAERMPAIYGSDPSARVLLLKDLGEAADFTDLYDGGVITEDELHSLAAYLRALHDNTRGEPDPEFENREMRALNHTHIFAVPLQHDNGLDLDVHEPGLQAAADETKSDAAFRVRVREIGEIYLRNGPCLLHGDFFPGSWLRTGDGPRVIDPEFCFYGEPEFDLGVAVAHFALARGPEASRSLLHAYAADFDAAKVVEYAAIEIMRRLIGVAQLPLPPTSGFRAPMLRRARHALLHAQSLSNEDVRTWF